MGRRTIHTVTKPWGAEEIWATTHHSIGKILYIKGGHRLSRKYHKIKNHTIRILEGTLTLEVGPLVDGGAIESIKLTAGDAYHLQARTIHRFCAEQGDVRVVEISNHGPSDSVRLEDDYRRITAVPRHGPQSDK